MAAKPKETFYIGLSHPFRLRLKNDGVAWTAEEMAAITKVAIKWNGTLYDSDTYPTGFDFTSYAATGDIEFRLGNIITNASSAGRDTSADVIVYTATYPNGLLQGQIDLIGDTI